MSAQRLNKDEIFNAVAELADGGQRQAFLDEVCAEDPQLRREIEDLLARDLEVGSFLESPPPGIGITEVRPVTEQPGDTIGPYKLLQQIGEGGMGVVYMAEQTEPIERRVALKIIKPGMDTRQVIRRFDAERQALAMMNHPNIAQVFDAGETDAGRPYFAMELVKGIPITQYCDEKRLTPRERLELFVPICQAVQHAHQKGIIHRDIKPSNVLLAEYDDRAIPKIIDFGIAKAIDQRLTEKTMFTEFGQVVGTVDYMSPEQAKLNQLDVDTRSDVYSLGVLLYELLTGETPFDRDRLRSAAFDELLRIIREEEPPRPSVRLTTSDALPSIAANRHVEPTKLSLLVRGELDWIVMKALEKNRVRRYATAKEFGEDVSRFLNDKVVQACPPSNLYRLRKYVRKHRVRLVTGAVVATAIVAVVVLSGLAYIANRRFEREHQIIRLDTTARAAAAEGKNQIAVERFAQLLDLQRLAYGRQSQPAMSTLRARADALARLGRYTEAVACRRSLANMCIEMHGQEHVDARKALGELVDVQLEAARHNIGAADADSLTDAIDFAREAITLTEKHNLDAWRSVMNRKTRSGYALLIESLYRNSDIKTCHDEARHWLGLPTSVKHYALDLYLALINMEEGREAIAADWFLAADQLWLGTGGSWKVTQRALRNEAAARILGSADAVPPQISTEEEETLYTRLLKRYPRAANLRHKRGYCRIQLGKWEEADDDFTEAVDQMPDAIVFLHATHALLSLHQERMADYQSECQWLVEYLKTRRRISERHAVAVIACLISPKAEVDHHVIYRLAGPNPLATGIAAYRLGKYTEAIDLLQSHKSGRRLALRLLFEAMAHYRLGSLEEAKTTLSEARQLIDQECPLPGKPKVRQDVSYFTSVVWCEALAVLREAEALIDNATP